MLVQQDALGAALTELRPSCSLPIRYTLSSGVQFPFPADRLTLHLDLRGSARVELDDPVWTRRVEEWTLIVANRGLRGRLGAISAHAASFLSTELRVEGDDGHSLLALLPRVMPIDADRVPSARFLPPDARCPGR